MNKLDLDYQNLLQDVLDNGVTKETRNGGTISVFGRQIRHKMSDGFPLLTTKKMAWKTMVTELLWFLRGDTNIKYLVDNGCHIWDGDAYKNFIKTPDYKSENVADLLGSQAGQLLICPTQEDFINKIKTDDEFANKWGDLGPVYGKQWRNWCGYEKVPSGWNHGAITHYKEVPKCDQIKNLINDLKTNPDSRRLMVNAWNVGELDQMTLPPCHYGFQVYTRGLSDDELIKIVEERVKNHQPFKNEDLPKRAISLMWNQRSVDTFLGLPFNIASYGLLLEIIAKAVNMVPDELIGNLGDTHLYLNHIEQAKEQIGKDLTDEERYHIWFGNNYETGMERFFDPNNLPNFNDVYYEPTPTRTREPYPLPTFKHLRSDDKYTLLNEFPSLWSEFKISDFEMENYQSHPTIKAPLSN
jgi:thymidylate synthase